jgi:hypothetical protein
MGRYYKYILLFYIIFASEYSFGQSNILYGHVSYLSSVNVYVKFENTNLINIGDTLKFGSPGINEISLVAKSKSSTSIVCQALQPHLLKINDKIYFQPKSILKNKEENPITEKDNKEKINEPINTDVVNVVDTVLPNKIKEKIRSSYTGRITASTNSSIGEKENFQRLRLALTFNINNINGGKISIQNYITFRHRYGVDQTNVTFYDDFKVYSLSLNYRINDKTILTFGRQINNKIANIGAIDGIQLDYKKNAFISGFFVGSRPDFRDYRFNASLLQGGAYIGLEKSTAKFTSQTSLAFVEQRNENFTDRRFAYFQHSMTAFKNLNVFGSLEMDMYQKINDTITNALNLTSAYFSMRYKFSKKLSLTTSYDNRRNVIFYESNRLYIDQLLNQETRQGWRIMANYNLLKNVNVSASSFYRYQQSFDTPTKNYVFNANMNRLLGSKLMLNLNHNIIATNYFDGNISGGTANYDLWKGKILWEGSYRKVNYQFKNSEQTIDQNIMGMGFSFYIKKMTMLLLNYEGTFEKDRNYHRYFVTAMQRFKNKK